MTGEKIVVKRLYEFFKPYKNAFLGSIICVMAECVFELVIPFLMANIIDVGVKQRDTGYILARGSLMAACALIAFFLGSIYARLGAKAGQGFGAELRQQEYKKLQEYSFSNLDHFSSASLITRLTSDIGILQNSICNGIRPMVRGPVLMFTGLVMQVSESLILYLWGKIRVMPRKTDRCFHERSFLTSLTSSYHRTDAADSPSATRNCFPESGASLR